MATPSPAARWSGCRIALPVGGYFRWFGVDVHHFERGTLEAEECGWIRAVLDPMASSPPMLLQAPSTSTINRELALSDTGTAATPSDFSIAPRPVNHDASANCSTKCPGGAVNMVAPAVKSAVAMAPVIISTHAADTPTTIDVVCSVVTFDVDSGGVVSATINIAGMPEVLPVRVKVLDREMLKCGGDFFKLYACNLIDVPVALGRICDVVQSSLFPSSDWLELQPWPPPDDLRLTSSDAALRLTPWLSFNMVEICSVSCYRGHVWRPPWPTQIGHQIRFVLIDLAVFWKYMMILVLGAMAMCAGVNLRPIPWPSFVFHEFAVQWCCVFDCGKCLQLAGILVRKFSDAEKPIASVFHGQLVLAAARALEIRTCQAWVAADAQWEEPDTMAKCTVAATLSTAATSDSHPEFISMFVETFGDSVAGSNKKILFLCGDYMEDYEVMIPFLSFLALGCPVDTYSDQPYSEKPSHDFTLITSFEGCVLWCFRVVCISYYQ